MNVLLYLFIHHQAEWGTPVSAIFTHFSKQASIDRSPSGKISKAFIISLVLPFHSSSLQACQGKL
jgi:hypothetical protein